MVIPPLALHLTLLKRSLLYFLTVRMTGHDRERDRDLWWRWGRHGKFRGYLIRGGPLSSPSMQARYLIKKDCNPGSLSFLIIPLLGASTNDMQSRLAYSLRDSEKSRRGPCLRFPAAASSPSPPIRPREDRGFGSESLASGVRSGLRHCVGGEATMSWF